MPCAGLGSCSAHAVPSSHIRSVYLYGPRVACARTDPEWRVLVRTPKWRVLVRTPKWRVLVPSPSGVYRLRSCSVHTTCPPALSPCAPHVPVADSTTSCCLGSCSVCTVLWRPYAMYRIDYSRRRMVTSASLMPPVLCLANACAHFHVRVGSGQLTQHCARIVACASPFPPAV